MSKHTPGPWRKRDRYVFTVINGQDCLLATVDSMDIPDSQIQPNARLIAAAPELLEECDWLLEVVNTLDPEGNVLTQEEILHLNSIADLLERLKGVPGA